MKKKKDVSLPYVFCVNSLVYWSAAEDNWVEDRFIPHPQTRLDACKYQSADMCQHVSMIKIDPYLNVDAGLMNPKEYV